mgnify:CR=1 FL=1
MDDPGRMGVHHWGNFDPSVKMFLGDHPALKLMDVVVERDTAVLERDTAVAEKRTAFAERDSALLQRDAAFADRNTAWMERNAAVAALSIVQSGKDTSGAVAKLMQMLNMSTLPLSMEPNPNVKDENEGQRENKGKDHARKPTPKKRKDSAIVSQSTTAGSNSPPKRCRKQKGNQDAEPKAEKEREDGIRNKAEAINPLNIALDSTPYCSCTGLSQQCYRWGKGGWQSACCTNFLSMYPLPMNPAKCNSRVPGRKMRSAFKKLLERLVSDGVDITAPIDLKNYWARHGTNRYVTIK